MSAFGSDARRAGEEPTAARRAPRADRAGGAARVVVLGSANMDLVATCAALPRPGETVLADGFTTVPGGKGANQAIAAARSGAARVAFLGAVGADPHGARIRELLRGAGVDLAGLRETPGQPTGIALIAVDGAGDNSIVVVPGANGTLRGLTAAELAALAPGTVVLAQLEVPVETVVEAFTAARASGCRTVLNAAPARPLPPDLLAVTDVLVVNEIEAAVVAGQDPDGDAPAPAPARLVDRALRLVPRVVLTLGERGVCYGDRDGVRLDVAAPRVHAVDTTAAGDTFVGYFAAGLAAGRTVAAALRLACAAASLSVERPGASSSIPDADEVARRWVQAYEGADGEAAAEPA